MIFATNKYFAKYFAMTKQRILQFIEFKRISKTVFFQSTGIKRGLLDSDKINSTVSDVVIAKILVTYPDLNIEWLLTGQGQMLKSTVPAVTNHTTEDATPGEQMIPVFELPKATSLAAFFTKLPNPVEHLYIPNLPKADGAVVMRGETMRPALNGGDIAVYKTMRNRRENILFGQMYLLSFVADDEEHIVIKYIQPSENKDNIKLVSANNYFGPLDIPFDSIQAMAMIKASIRYETMS